jgi:bis(5'-nucleosyl)-tetraphosphatase (symmetrical)
MTTYAIGDVQGCFDELLSLLEEAEFDETNDRLWFTGDLVNRGPQSLEVLRFVKGLGDSAITVLGNHDLHLLAVSAGIRKSRLNDTFSAILASPDADELLAWLRHRPLMHHDPAAGYVLIHAGMPPQWSLAKARACATEVETVLQGNDYIEFIKNMYGNEPDQWDESLSGWGRLRLITNCLTRLRYCDRRGHLALDEKGPPGSQPDRYLPWFELWDYPDEQVNIIFGHWSTLGNCQRQGFHALDTGCVWGGALTAIRLDGSAQRISIKCNCVSNPRED